MKKNVFDKYNDTILVNVSNIIKKCNSKLVYNKKYLKLTQKKAFNVFMQQ